MFILYVGVLGNMWNSLTAHHNFCCPTGPGGFWLLLVASGCSWNFLFWHSVIQGVSDSGSMGSHWWSGNLGFQNPGSTPGLRTWTPLLDSSPGFSYPGMLSGISLVASFPGFLFGIPQDFSLRFFSWFSFLDSSLVFLSF